MGISTFYLACILLASACSIGLMRNLRVIIAELMAAMAAPVIVPLPPSVLLVITPLLPLIIHALVYNPENARGINYNDVLFKVEFPLGAVGLLLIALLGTRSTLFLALYHISYVMRYMTVYTLNLYHVTRYELPAVWVGGYMDCIRCIGQVLGYAIPCYTLPRYGLNPSTSICAVAGAVICLLVSVYLQSETNDRTDWGHSKIGSEDEPTSQLERACKRITSEFALSARESEVLLHLARGNSQKKVAELLFVSPETVKTHTRNVYHKLGVHTKQELIDFVRTRRKGTR